MKIERLEIRSFGKFHDKHIELAEGINLFCGENEIGKSTVYAFIKSMLFDIERGRGKAASNDMFHQYEPWDMPAYYSGMMQFECGGKHFQLERDFTKNGKKTRLFCLDDGEELSEQDGDLEAILSDLDKAGFENTAAVAQLRAEPGPELAKALKNLAANYYTAGTGNVDLEAALSGLQKRKKEIQKSVSTLSGKRQKECEKSELELEYCRKEIERLSRELEEIREQTEERLPRERKKQGNGIIEGLLVVCVILIAAFIFLPPEVSYIGAGIILAAAVVFGWKKVKRRKKEHEDVDKTEKDFQELTWKKARIRQEIQEKKIACDNLREQIAETYELGEEEKLLQKRQSAIEFAIQRMTQISKSVHQEVGTKLNEKAGEILGEITNGKYTQLFVDDRLDISVFSENRKIPAARLSRGTVEQVYFSVRMAASELLYEEEYPVILDDTFAYYDEERMKAAIRWLAEHKKQVLLFSCHKREKEALDQMHITYRDGWN